MIVAALGFVIQDYDHLKGKLLNSFHELVGEFDQKRLHELLGLLRQYKDIQSLETFIDSSLQSSYSPELYIVLMLADLRDEIKKMIDFDHHPRERKDKQAFGEASQKKRRRRRKSPKRQSFSFRLSFQQSNADLHQALSSWRDKMLVFIQSHRLNQSPSHAFKPRGSEPTDFWPDEPDFSSGQSECPEETLRDHISYIENIIFYTKTEERNFINFCFRQSSDQYYRAFIAETINPFSNIRSETHLLEEKAKQRSMLSQRKDYSWELHRLCKYIAERAEVFITHVQADYNLLAGQNKSSMNEERLNRILSALRYIQELNPADHRACSDKIA